MILPVYTWADSTSWRSLDDLTFYELQIGFEEGFKNSTRINMIKEDAEGILWMGGREGDLFRFNGHSLFNAKDFINKTQDGSLNISMVRALAIDDDQDIWLGSKVGLFKINSSDLKCTKIELDQPLHPTNYRNHVTAIMPRGDTLFVGTQNGLYLVDRASGQVLKGFFNEGQEKRHISVGTHTTIGGVYPGMSAHEVWLSFSDSLCQLNTLTGISHTYGPGFLEEGQVILNQGITYHDTVALMPSERHGLVTFNLKEKTFSNCLIDLSDFVFNSNDMASAVPIDDSLTLVTAYNWGTGLLNRYTCAVHWLRVPVFLQFGAHKLFLDDTGYGWTGIGGKLFITDRAIVSNPNGTSKPIIDVTDFFVNEIKKGMPFLEAYPVYRLGEYERNIELTFSLTQAHAFDSIRYEYQLNGTDWQYITTPNHLRISNPINGKNNLSIRAIGDGQIIAQRILSFHIFFPFYKSVWFYLCFTVAILSIGYGLARYRIAQVRKEERLKAEYEKKLAELESMALRSQINPHFIFNTLNSIKYYAIKKTPSETGEFINRFSVLIRQILENSKKGLIPLREEIETLSNYIEVEKLRFRNAFTSIIEVDPSIDQDFFMIPPSLLQPFVENAIWHGLMHQEGEKQLRIRIAQEESMIVCEISDNGIGREAAASIYKAKKHKSSLGVSITKQRIEHLQTVYGIESDFEIIDRYDVDGKPAGTKVLMRFSI